MSTDDAIRAASAAADQVPTRAPSSLLSYRNELTNECRRARAPTVRRTQVVQAFEIDCDMREDVYRSLCALRDSKPALDAVQQRRTWRSSSRRLANLARYPSS